MFVEMISLKIIVDGLFFKSIVKSSCVFGKNLLCQNNIGHFTLPRLETHFVLLHFKFMNEIASEHKLYHLSLHLQSSTLDGLHPRLHYGSTAGLLVSV